MLTFRPTVTASLVRPVAPIAAAAPATGAASGAARRVARTGAAAAYVAPVAQLPATTLAAQRFLSAVVSHRQLSSAPPSSSSAPPSSSSAPPSSSSSSPPETPLSKWVSAASGRATGMAKSSWNWVSNLSLGGLYALGVVLTCVGLLSTETEELPSDIDVFEATEITTQSMAADPSCAEYWDHFLALSMTRGGSVDIMDQLPTLFRTAARMGSYEMKTLLRIIAYLNCHGDYNLDIAVVHSTLHAALHSEHETVRQLALFVCGRLSSKLSQESKDKLAKSIAEVLPMLGSASLMLAGKKMLLHFNSTDGMTAAEIKQLVKDRQFSLSGAAAKAFVFGSILSAGISLSTLVPLRSALKIAAFSGVGSSASVLGLGALGGVSPILSLVGVVGLFGVQRYKRFAALAPLTVAIPTAVFVLPQVTAPPALSEKEERTLSELERTERTLRN